MRVPRAAMRAHGTHHKAEAEFCQHELPVRSFIPRVPEVYGRKLMSAGSEQAAEDSCRGGGRVKEGQPPPPQHPAASSSTSRGNTKDGCTPAGTARRADRCAHSDVRDPAASSVCTSPVEYELH